MTIDWSNALVGDPALELARAAESGVRSGAFDVVVANISEIVIGELKPEFERVAPRRILSGFQDHRGEWTCVVE